MRKNTLLLVEDSEDDAFLFNRTFQKSGAPFSIDRVQNGAEAIDYLRNAESKDSLPGIILLDLKMPMVNGFEVLQWIQGETLCSQIPVVVLSGSAQPEDRFKASQLGATEYLVKPVTAPDLQRLFSAFLSNARPQADSEVKA